MEPADWAAEDLEASKKFEERMSERRVTLDNYEERRKLQTEKWEKDRMNKKS
ncbi:hypothetical protein DIPPA_32431 [Diplonema papillatum]|nr:hypothetical protein DIPPA_32431 [Diplonema papillatum]